MGIKKTFPAQAAERTKELGYRVRLARTRRGMSIAELAAKADLNRNTLNALELGKPGVAFGAYVTVLWALCLDNTLDGVAQPHADIHGNTLEASRRPAGLCGLPECRYQGSASDVEAPMQPHVSTGRTRCGGRGNRRRKTGPGTYPRAARARYLDGRRKAQGNDRGRQPAVGRQIPGKSRPLQSPESGIRDARPGASLRHRRLQFTSGVRGWTGRAHGGAF